MTKDENPTLPYYGIDDETGEQHFGPCDEKEAIETRNGHPRHAHIELRRRAAGEVAGPEEAVVRRPGR